MKHNLHPVFFFLLLLLFMACNTRPVSDFIRKSPKNLFRAHVLVKCSFTEDIGQHGTFTRLF